MWKVGNYTKNRHKPMVLICDQEPHVRNVLLQYLTSVGFHAEQARNGYECIELACVKHPDVILLDLELPNMDGHATMVSLRKLGINVPVILFSTGKSAQPYDDDSAVLQKPFRPREIAMVLEALLLETKTDKHFVPRRFKIH